MGVIHAVFSQEWRVLGLLLLGTVLDCEGLSGKAGGWGALVVLTAAQRILLLPAPRRGVGGSGGRIPDGSGSGGAPAVAGVAVWVAGGGGGGRGVSGG